MKNRFSLTALAFFVIALSTSFLAKAEEAADPARLLLENKFAEAEKGFLEAEKNGTTEEKLAALEGLYACGYIKADFGSCFEYLKKMVVLSAPRADGIGVYFLERLNRLSRVMGKEEEVFALCRELEKTRGIDPGCLMAIRQDISNGLFAKRYFKEAIAYGKDSSPVKQYTLVGPFRVPEGVQIDIPLPPETSPGLAEYKDETGRKVYIKPNLKTGANGYLSASDQIPETPFPAVAYAYVLLKSDRDQDVALNINGYSKIWLRGMPVYHPDLFKGKYRSSYQRIKIRLKKGLNPIVMKAPVRGFFSLPLSAPEGGATTGIESVDYQPAEFAKYPCRNYSGVLMGSVLRPRHLEGLEKLPVQEPFRSLWLAGAGERAGEVQQARSLRNRLLEQYPDSVLMLLSVAGSRQHEASFGIDSADRLNKEAMDFYAKVLKQQPENYSALVQTALHASQHEQTERALRLMREAVKLYPDVAMGHRLLADLYEKQGWTELAESEYRKMVKAAPEFDLVAAVFYENNDRKTVSMAIRQKAWNERRIGFNMWSRIDQLTNRHDWDDAKKLLDEWHKYYPENTNSYRSRLTSILYGMGDRKELEKLYKLKAEENPEIPDYQLQLANFYMHGGNTEEAQKYFAAARELMERNEDVPPEFRRRMRKFAGAELDLDKYDIKLESIDHAGVKKEDHPEANYATVLRLEVHRIYPDRSCESMVHTAVKVLDKTGVGGLSELYVPQGADDLLFCRTVQPDGEIYVPTSVENMGFDKATSMYKVQPGSVLEYAYRQAESGGRNQTWNGRYMVEDFRTPVIRGRYCLIVPKKLAAEMSVQINPEDILPSVTEDGDDMIFLWDFENRKGRKPEQNIPSDGKALASINVRILAPAFSSGELRRDRELRTSEEIEKLATAITKDIANDAEKVSAIHRWISENIKDSSGGQTARDALALKSSDSNGKAMLCRAMLAALGIEAEFALANTALANAATGTREMRRRSAGRFSYPQLLHVKMPEEADIWLRFNNPARHYTPGDIGYNMVGVPTLEADEDGLLLSTVRGEAQETARDESILLALQEDGSAAVRGSMIFHGSWAGYMRTRTEDPQQGPKFVDQVAGSLFPKMVIEHADYPDGGEEDTGEKLDIFPIRFRGEIKQFCRRENGDLVFTPFLAPVGAQQLIAPLPRENDFELMNDFINFKRISFTAPKGYAFSTVPNDRYINTEFGLFFVDFNVTGNRLTVSRGIIVPRQRLLPNEYEGFNKFIGYIQRMERMSVKISPLPIEEFGGNLTEFKAEGDARKIDVTDYAPRYWPKDLKLPGATEKKVQ